MSEISGLQRRTKVRLRLASAALPACLLLGVAAGIGFGAPAIGAAIGAGIGFGLAVVLFAAAVVARAGDPRL